MQVHLFRSTTQIGTIAFTADESGANLPPDLGPWEQPLGTSFAAEGLLKDKVAQAIKRDGHYIQRPKP
jgi:hypothetical protein